MKRSLSGLEIEVQTLNKQGHIVNEANTIIKECKKVKREMLIIKEFSRNIVELCSFPSVKVQNTLLDMLDNLQIVLDVAKNNGIIIYPLSVYPGSFKPKMSRSMYYRFKARYIHAKDTSGLEGKTPAFHFHYTLPRGMFDHRKKFLKMQIAPKIKQTLLDSYNMGIAMDPALITLFQSSPLLDGKYIAKDCRALIQRTGKFLPFKGLYSRHPALGGLPIYKNTVVDLINTIERRYAKVKEIVDKNNLDPAIPKRYKRVLDYGWHAVRINKIGTLEQRTMDMNHPKYVIAGSVLMKYIHRKIHQEFLRIIPSDIGMNEPFKQEGNIVHVPPNSYLRKKLQLWSICEGFENKEIMNYTKRLFRFGKRCTHPKFYDAIRPFERMIERKQSVSDVILKRLKKWGYERGDQVPDNVCARLALFSSRQLYNEIEKTKKKIIDLE